MMNAVRVYSRNIADEAMIQPPTLQEMLDCCLECREGRIDGDGPQDTRNRFRH
jgi:hypothetical protein